MAPSEPPDPALIEVDPPEPVDIPADPAARWQSLHRIGVKLPLRDYLRELWRRREFVLTIPMGERRAQNQDTVLGNIWHLLNPLFLIGVYYLVFGVFMEMAGRQRGDGIDNFLGFLVVGVITFDYTRNAVNSGARMIVKNRALVRSINFPRAVLPLSGLVSESLGHLYAIPLMWFLLALTGEYPQWAWFLIVPIVMLQAMFNLGVGMIVARLTFHMRDVQQVLPYALRIWFYMSGVLFPVTMIDQPVIRTILELNPMFAFVDLSRSAFMDGEFAPYPWAVAATWSVLALVIGFFYFRSAESEYGRV